MSGSFIPPIASPTASLIRDYLSKWQTLEKYVFQEKSLGLLFQEFCPRSDDISHVLLKVSALNDFYSTNIYDTHAVSKHIVDSNVDERIALGDPSVVNQIALVSVGSKQRNFYSFASKYCNHHNPEAFPIFDSYVEKMLTHFQECNAFARFTRQELKQYSRFVGVIGAFKNHYALDRFSLREIDIYLWLAGKDRFARHRKKSVTETA